MRWDCIADTACQLGEGICWIGARQAMFFVDIHGRRLLSYGVADGALRRWAAPERIGWVIPVAGDEALLAGFQSGVALVRPGEPDEHGEGRLDIVRWIVRPFDGRPQLRLNDAKADRHGRVWAGSLNNDDESRPEGALFCLDQGGWRQVDDGYGVANGPAISPDGGLLLHTDSAARTIYAFDLDGPPGAITGKRVWKRFTDAEGYPDGMNFDAQGHLWVAHWGAGCISQFHVDGTLLQRLRLPASHITNVAFGGERLDRLFVTSARQGLSLAQLAEEPLAGGLFEVHEHGATGLAPCAYFE